MNKTVLVIEDDPALQKALVGKLSHSGFTVLSAFDGEEGLKVALEKHPDLITLDIMMPVKDGNAFLDDIRKDPWGMTVHIIVLTNYNADDAMISKIVADHPSYYFIKAETSLEEIVTKAKELTNSPHQQ